MKKLAVAIIAVTVTSVAFAATIAVPFFADNYSATENVSARGFIGIKSNSTEDLMINVFYYDNDGVNSTPTLNSFELKAGTSKSWRPSVGVNAGTDLDPSDTTLGSSVIAWDGAPTDIQGRYSQGQYELDQRVGQAMYLLPDGIAGG